MRQSLAYSLEALDALKVQMEERHAPTGLQAMKGVPAQECCHSKVEEAGVD